jgi:hypothetical protein
MKKPKNLTARLMLIAIATALLAACELETSDCGRIGGYWQLHTIDTLISGTSTPIRSADMRKHGVTWSFQATMMQVRSIQYYEYYYLSFEDRGDSLYLFAPYHADRDNGCDVPMTSADTLRHMGIPATQTTYAIRQLNSSTMVLQNDSLLLHFRKY